MGGFLARLIVEAELGRPHPGAVLDAGNLGRAIRGRASSGADRAEWSSAPAVPRSRSSSVNPLVSWVLYSYLDKYRRMDPHAIVTAAVDTIVGGIASDVRADYLACYAGDRFVESMRYVRVTITRR